MRARTSALRFVSCVVPAQERAGEALGARSMFAAWNSSTESPNAPGIAADLVQREQPDVAVERRVLDALRHHRARSSAGSA